MRPERPLPPQAQSVLRRGTKRKAGGKDEKEKKKRIVWAGPALASDRLILLNSQGQAFSLSPYSGEVLGKIELKGAATMAPVFANATMYVLDDDGDLTAYR